MLCHFFQRHGVMCLFDGIDGITLFLQVLHGVEGLFVIGPIDGLFGAQSGLMDLLVRRTATDPAEYDAFDTHSVRRTEDCAYVMLAADVIEHDDQGQFVCFVVLGHAHSTHLSGG